MGWSTSSTATAKTYSSGANFSGNSKTTLYAVWKAQGGTWTSTGVSYTTHIYKKVYMPKNVATDYYLVLSDEKNFEWVASQIISLGAARAASKIASKFTIPGAVAGGIVEALLLLDDYTQFMKKTNFKKAMDNCPKNGFVVIEYWQIKNPLTGQMFPSLMHENATTVNSDGSFKAGVYSAN